ncbi:hypothetical protein [Nonomuraea sp. NPDC049129]
MQINCQIKITAPVLAAYPQTDVLADNAGGLFGHEVAKDGFDRTF